MMRWYAVYERQSVEEEIASEYLHPEPPAKSRALPAPRRMRVLVDERIAKKREEEERADGR